MTRERLDGGSIHPSIFDKSVIDINADYLSNDQREQVGFTRIC